MKKHIAIVLAAGSGKRMNSAVPKQYMMLAGKPVIYYALRAFEESGVSGIVLVAGAGGTEYCRSEIIGKYGFSKVDSVVEGGRERSHSVYQGLLAAKGADYVLIHDGARPLVTADLIRQSMECVEQFGACAAGMPVKDTIKLVGKDGFAIKTPDRSSLWQVQTPQSFAYPLILKAYEKVVAEDIAVTDDAMALEIVTGQRVKMLEGGYRNIKITTPEDLAVAEVYLGGCGKEGGRTA